MILLPDPTLVKPKITTPRFFVRAGTPCGVRNLLTNTDLEPYTTTRSNSFEKFERYEKNEVGSFYEFRSETGGWLILVRSCFVVCRNRPRWR